MCVPCEIVPIVDTVRITSNGTLHAAVIVPEEVLLDWLRVGVSFILVFFIGQLYLRYLSGVSLRFGAGGHLNLAPGQNLWKA